MCLNISKKGNGYMEEKLLKLIKLADLLNERQDKVYAQIEYIANEYKKLEIIIRSKEDYSCLEKCEIYLYREPTLKWSTIVDLFETYVGGVGNE